MRDIKHISTTQGVVCCQSTGRKGQNPKPANQQNPGKVIGEGEHNGDGAD